MSLDLDTGKQWVGGPKCPFKAVSTDGNFSLFGHERFFSKWIVLFTAVHRKATVPWWLVRGVALSSLYDNCGRRWQIHATSSSGKWMDPFVQFFRAVNLKKKKKKRCAFSLHWCPSFTFLTATYFFWEAPGNMTMKQLLPPPLLAHQGRQPRIEATRQKKKTQKYSDATMPSSKLIPLWDTNTGKWSTDIILTWLIAGKLWKDVIDNLIFSRPSFESLSVSLIDSSQLPSRNVVRLFQYWHVSVTACETF